MSALDRDAVARLIVDAARELGFHRVGIAPVEPAARHDVYVRWLAAGHAGEMAWLARPDEVAARRHPRGVLPSARTVVVAALSYAAPDTPAPEAEASGPGAPARSAAGSPHGRIARYARGEDYHLVLKRKLGALAERLTAALGRPVGTRACVDTAPLLERDLAERAGVGFVAKNTLLIAPGLGSYVVLGELLLDVEATPTATEPERKRCGDCRACLDACPTGAIVDSHVVDARRCISYLTIELGGPIPRDLRPLVGSWIFGCDLCQEICPHNAAAAQGRGPPAAPELMAAGRDHATPALLPLLRLGAAQFRRYVARSALRRVRREQLLRNVCVALGNSGDPAAVPGLREALGDRHPLVRAHAAWALGRLGEASALRAALLAEVDPLVREELELALLDLAVPAS